jgi:hypothetical protein
VDIVYFNNKKNKNKEEPILHYYLKSMSIFNRIFKGTFVVFNKFLAFNFNHANNTSYNNKFKDNIFKFLFFSFKKMFSLISKPVFIFTPDKVVINLFYYILLPSLLKKKNLFHNSKLKKMKNIKNKLFKFKTFDKYLSKKNKIIMKNKINTNNNKINKKEINKQDDFLYFFKTEFKKTKNDRLLDLDKNNNKQKYFTKVKLHRRNYSLHKKINLFKKINLINRIKLKNLVEISLIKMFPKKFENICRVLSKFLNKKIELNLIRLHYPYKDSHILANYLQLVINRIKFVLITRKIFRFAVIKKLTKLFIRKKINIIPSFLTGLKIKVAGRLMKYKVIPRKTVKLTQRGSSSTGTVNYTSFSRVTSKNRRGAYSITVSSGQNFF